MKLIVLTTVMLFGLVAAGAAQSTLSLEQCFEKAEATYPLVRERDHIRQAREYSLENAAKGHLPQVTFGAQATYQSDVTRMPIEVPGVDPLSKDQYRGFGEISQTVYHGRSVSVRKSLADASSIAEERKFDADMYQIRSRVSDLFFGILLLQEQASQSRLVRADLESSLTRIEAAIKHGTALRSTADVMRAEILRMDQRIIEMESIAGAYRIMLGQFIGEPVDVTTTLEKPVYGPITSGIDRPELRWFKAQSDVIVANEKSLSASRTPRLEAFLQAGYGRPGLNMLENRFDYYYIGGLRLSWPLAGYYTLNNERQILALKRRSLDVQKDAFLFNTNLGMVQQREEITRLEKLISVDDEIIGLRTGVRETASVQLEQGIISSSDFIREINAEDQAKQNRVLHETQLLLARARYQFTSGQ